MSAPTLASPPAVVAVTAAFVANGAAVGVMGGLIPTLTLRMHTNAQGIGLLLVCYGVSAIVGINIGGRVSDARGATRPIQAGLVVMAVGTVLVSFATSLPTGLLLGLVYGLGNGLTDVSMNAMAVQVEQARPRPLMSRFHASFSIGTLGGAGVVLVLGALLPTRAALTIAGLALAAVVLVVAAVAVQRYAVQTATVDHVQQDGRRVAIPRAAWILAVMAICFGITEGTATDWSSVQVTDVAHVSTATGAWGLACVSAFMVVVRLLGDLIVHRIGRRAVVRWGGALAVVGYLVGVVVHTMPLLLLGWCIVGAGVALVAPQIYGLAGQAGGGRTLSVVVTTGYTAFLVGPGIMGALVHRFGVQDALLFPLVLGVCLSGMSVIMPNERHAARGRYA
ncbi:MFS transporter [Leekyejoonella antrihumi]|uniref:MFS transporter n=1 Tax=Leekyejoonella antrihumi TaxID=1660198 RepID=A0A563DZM0_9MICO|nr:MFS transporter [Leekyejoonella antrihumi]TWP35569.1 MFS transporter [Leekyejoonella antrihumi]